MLGKILNVIAYPHNWLSDKDFIWWPFSFLKPAPKTFMSFKLTLLMTACFGGLAFVMFTVFSVVNNMFTVDSLFTTLLYSFGGFFLWFNLITKPLWNIRARQLNKRE
jgi:hypothetical protein